jgi:hypothetical protein
MDTFPDFFAVFAGGAIVVVADVSLSPSLAAGVELFADLSSLQEITNKPIANPVVNVCNLVFNLLKFIHVSFDDKIYLYGKFKQDAISAVALVLNNVRLSSTDYLCRAHGTKKISALPGTKNISKCAAVS